MLDMIEAPEAPTTDITTLPPADRAAAVLNSSKTEADLKQLASSLKAITLVNSPAGRDQAHALAMTARSARTAIEKAGKVARDDATKFSKAVIAEEDRLIEIIQPEETRVLGLRNAWDAAEAAHKEAEAQKERDRIAAHQAVIAKIKSYPMLAATARTSEVMIHLLGKLHEIDTFNGALEEFTDAAHAAKIAADESLSNLIDTKKAEEAEAVRIKFEQGETARLLAEQQAEQAEAARVLAEHQAELLAQQARMKAQQEELDRRAAEMAQQAAELEARKQAEAKRLEPVVTQSEVAALATDPREALAQVMSPIHIEALTQVSHAQLEQDVALVQQPATVDEMHAIGEGIRNEPEAVEPTPPALAMAKEIAFAYGVEPATAIHWLAERADEFKTMNTITEVKP